MVAMLMDGGSEPARESESSRRRARLTQPGGLANFWDAAQIVSKCTTDIGPGEIILLHVGASAPGDVESLPGMIDAFSQAGYRFVTIEQMLQP